MTGLDPTRSIADNYRSFGRFEAAGRSPTYERLALAVADEPAMLDFLARLPAGKWQPNLFFAAARLLLDRPPDVDGLRRLVTERAGDLRTLMLERLTQTNEAGRCALLLPALLQLPQPLALIEVGASAGLTLLPDRYSYDYLLPGGSHHRLSGPDRDAPVMACRVTGGSPPLPDRLPDVVWRSGLDLNPLDVWHPDDVAWLQALVWPDQPHREQRLRRAIAVARRDPPRVVAGDLLDDLPPLVAQAPRDVTVVVYHCAALAYVDAEKRRAFADLIADLGVTWLSYEGQNVLADVEFVRRDVDALVLVRDGRRPLAFADGHATWLDWISP